MTEEADLRTRIDALLAFLPAFEQEGDAWPGEWKGGEKDAAGVIQMPWFDFSDTMLEFMRACAGNGWVAPGISWVEPGLMRELIEQPAALSAADTDLIRQLLTTHVRGDRFHEGHLAAMVQNGHLLAILRRLAAIRDGL